MFPHALLSLVLILVALTAVDASLVSRNSGKATLNFATRMNAGGTINIAEKDRARARAMKQAGQLGKRTTFEVNAINNGTTYVAEVGVGSPPTSYTLVIDTGSANTWVGAGNPYVKTQTSQDTGNTVAVTYGSGNFSGEEWIDTVTLSPDLVIKEQRIGVASSSYGFTGFDGILGVGPVDLTYNSVSGVELVPTVSDNLLSQKIISQEVLGIYYIPISETSENGKLTFGGYDESATVGPVVYVPLTTTSPASYYWGIEQSVSYGADTILSSTAGTIDTGTTLILFATDVFNVYQSKTGATMDPVTQLLMISSDQYANLQPLVFNIGDVPFVLTPNAQIWPRSLNTYIGGSSDAIYLVVNDIGNASGSGLDFTNGYTFLERFYSVFDTTNQRVGFAYTDYTFCESN